MAMGRTGTVCGDLLGSPEVVADPGVYQMTSLDVFIDDFFFSNAESACRPGRLS